MSDTDGLQRQLKALARLAGGLHEIERIVVETTLLAHEAIVEKITNDIEPHSGLHRKNNPQEVVTDLVDTGAYRASWYTAHPSPFVGEVESNSEYAPVIEYGTLDGKRKGYYVRRSVTLKMAPIFAEKVQKRIQELLG